MSGDVLVLVEHDGTIADRLSLEALSLAAGLADATGGRVEAVLVGARSAAVAPRLGGMAALVHAAEDARLAEYAPAAWAAVLVGLIEASSPSAVVGPGSDRGNEVLAHVGARTGYPMAANVLAATPGSSWQVTRQRWAGSLLEDARLDAPVRLLTVAPHAVAPAEPAGELPKVVQVTAPVDEADLRVRVIGREPPAAGVSLTDARVVVGGGRGVGSAAGFSALEELAGLLGGAVGVSRAVTSAGWRPHREQVGQTGVRIAPELYVACGISGAIQHIVGCKSAKRILAINTDPDSPIMAVADYAIYGDVNTVVPAISAEIRRRSGGAQG
ncbi:MAG: electron transfer flavoprotein subunit alpha/FixB family protein [Chloroflexota bacterium]